MRSTFYGLGIAKRGLDTSQISLDVASQNISNINTDGYSRQAVDQSSISPDASASQYARAYALAGQGVTINGIKQLRDDFLDLRYRNANSELNTNKTNLSALQSIENVLDETNNDGLSSALQGFYTALQNLSSNAGDTKYAGLLRSAAQKVTEVINQYDEQFQQTKSETVYDLKLATDSINSLVQKIDVLNNNIKIGTINGLDCNELKDSRNFFLDKLSGYMNLSVEGNEDGTVSVLCGNNYLLDAKNGVTTTLAVDSSSDTIQIIDDSFNEFPISQGSVKGYLQSLNGIGNYAGDGEESFTGIAYFSRALDDFAKSFADTFNELNSTSGGDKSLFSGDDSGNITAATLSISKEWLTDPDYITLSKSGQASNGNITDMIDAMNADREISSVFTGSFEDFSSLLTDGIAISVNTASDLTDSCNTIVNSILDEREAVSGVSTDEETVNMIKFQKAYQASARLMTAMDEMLETLINKMGVVGL